MRVLVCGGRGYDDRAKVCRVLDKLSVTCVIQGGASGADMFGYSWAKLNRVPLETYDDPWRRLRWASEQMLDEGKPDLVLAFPGGRGTENMITQALKRGVTVRRFE